ncbi:MAG TPA: hypothetical protein VMA73_26925 [Streptosporangiaceae bacterium]|nr:hypothetical protein [Streptosporangiaceae bacterium]
MRLLNPKNLLAAAATLSILVLISVASPSMAATASVHTASSNPQSAAALTCPVYTYNWYLENADTYSVMEDTGNSTWISVHQLQRLGNIIWNFCQVGTNDGDPIFELVDEGTYGVVGDCAADTGPVLGDGTVAYFEFKSCSASGTSFIERPDLSGSGFRLESLYELNNNGTVDYIAVNSPTNNYRLFLAPAGQGWNLWNGAACGSSTSC